MDHHITLKIGQSFSINLRGMSGSKHYLFHPLANCSVRFGLFLTNERNLWEGDEGMIKNSNYLKMNDDLVFLDSKQVFKRNL